MRVEAGKGGRLKRCETAWERPPVSRAYRAGGRIGGSRGSTWLGEGLWVGEDQKSTTKELRH